MPLKFPDPQPSRRRCQVGRWYDELDGADRAEFDDAVARIEAQRATHGLQYNAGYTLGWLAAGLAANDVTFDRNALGRHIRQQCACKSS